MNKKVALVGVILVLALAWSMNAYADAGSPNAWEGFWNSVGGFAYNALPWNWGNWMGK